MLFLSHVPLCTLFLSKRLRSKYTSVQYQQRAVCCSRARSNHLLKYQKIKNINKKKVQLYNTFDHAPRIRSSSDSPAIDFDKNVTSDHSKGNAILQRRKHTIKISDLRLLTNNRRERTQSLDCGVKSTRCVTFDVTFIRNVYSLSGLVLGV